jgi:cyclase
VIRLALISSLGLATPLPDPTVIRMAMVQRTLPRHIQIRSVHTFRELLIEMAHAAHPEPSGHDPLLPGLRGPRTTAGSQPDKPVAAQEFYRYEAPDYQPGRYRTLIVARIAPGAGAAVARIFAESDSGSLPAAIGVTARSLFRWETLYLHYIEGLEPIGPAVARLRDHPDFTAINEQLDAHITAYDPATWRTPADAMAAELYSTDSVISD